MFKHLDLKYPLVSLAACGIVVLIAMGVDEAINNLDKMLIPCQHGTTYTSRGDCSCIDTPFIGKYCGVCNCVTGYCTIGGTTPRITSDYGCKCPERSKFFGFLCDQCNTKNITYDNLGIINTCTGECKDGFFGTRCDRTCFANLSHYDTLDGNTTGDETTCRLLRTNGGSCNACSGHGSCKDGFCECDKNYFDDGMARCAKTCPPSSNGLICSGRGACKLFGNTPGCLCESGWRGDTCEIACPGIEDTGKACNGHGNCMMDFKDDGSIFASCTCNEKFRGDACEFECPGVGEACTGHGTCLVQNNEATCICETGMLDWVGTGCNCTDLLSCNGHGSCVADPYMIVTSGMPDLSLSKKECKEYATSIGMPFWHKPSHYHYALGCSKYLVDGNIYWSENPLAANTPCGGGGHHCIQKNPLLGQCLCEGNYDGKNCLKCKPNWYGSKCQFYCDSEADYDNDDTKVGCHGRGTCTVINLDTVFENVVCECDTTEVRIRINGRMQNFFSSFSPDLNCKDCFDGYFPKLDIFNTYDTTLDGLYVPCQVPCVPSTCNELGICNDKFGAPDETLCICEKGENGLKHISEDSFCTQCDANWFPDRVREPVGCTNFCISDKNLIGDFPAICDEGDIDCVHCNGVGSCNADGACECEEGYTGDFCQIQCTSPNGIICGGHGTCSSNELQTLLQFELEYIEDSGPLFQCTCDPQDPYSKEAREQYTAEGGQGQLDPPPDPTYFGETCDYNCVKPPWKESDECNGLGNCTIFEILDPMDNNFECTSDEDCTSTDITRILSGDNNWHDKKGPFCNKHEYPDGCDNDNYHLDNCIDILTLQRPEAARREKCVEDTLCRHTLDSFDWHQWCTNMEAVATPPIFESCGEITQFCPVQTIDSKCSDYVTLSTGTDISAHMDYCYENDKKRYPFDQTREYRLADESAILHDRIVGQMMQYNEEHPTVDIDIQPYCTDHMRKFDTVISKVDQNKRFACGSLILSEDTCIYGSEELTDTWTPFTLYCPNESPVKYSTLEQAENNRGYDCYIKEDESRRTVPNAGNVPFGGVCFGDSDCANGYCNGNTCCSSSIEHCAACNTFGQCTTCKDGTTWDGIQCAGTPTYTLVTGLEQKEGLDMIDTTCSAIETKFPRCSEPQNACDLNPCKDGDTCTPSDKDGICETKGILDCTCKFGLTCVPVSFSKYKCVGEFVTSTCPQEYMNFNWAGYCQTNNPVLKQETFGSNLLEQKDPPSSITLTGTEQTTEYIHYWVQPTTIYSSSKYVEITSGSNVVARIYMHQGQIQLNEIEALESCPNTNPTCQADWSYQPNSWYHLELSIDYLNRKVSLVNLAKPLKSLEKDFDCVADGCHSIQSISEVTFNGNTLTYFDQIIFEKDVANPSLYTACDAYPYCDVDVNYRNKCSDIIRNVQYPLLLEPSHDIVDTCKNFFEYQSFDSYSLTYPQEDAIQRLDWDTYCLFYDSIPANQYNCGNNAYQYFENYNNCRNFLDPLDGSKQCMSDAMGYDWTEYCYDLDMAAVPPLIRTNCPKPCYKRFKNYQKCEERLELFEDNTNLKNSACPDKWYPFCKEVAMNKHKGICSGVECQCDRERYEGVSGTSCELQCPVAADGTACGEEMGVGKCVYSEKDQKKIDNGYIDQQGNLIAFDGTHFEILGECNCYLTEGKRNCDQECFRCNETAYKETLVSGTYTTTTQYKVLDMKEDDIVTGVITSFSDPFNVSISMDNQYYEPIDIVNNVGNDYQIRAFGRFVKVVPPFDFELKITRAGQVGMCNGATGVCQCLPPYTAIIEEKYTNWRGQHRKRLKRLYNLPQEYDAEEEFRIRAMQGKEVFVKQFLKRQDNTMAYSASEYPRWKDLYHDLRDNPETYKCMPDRSCNAHDLILLGNLDESSYRYNFDCNTECQGTDSNTLIPCTGHGSCRVTGDCVCDPAAYVKGTNEVTGFSMEFNLASGETIENSEYEVSKFDRTGWRGTDCGKMCPGYDPATKSMLNVCGGRGICNDDAECECFLGYTGDYCQFTCPGFTEGEENVCSGHGQCVLNLIEIILQPEVVLYDGYCGGAGNSAFLTGYNSHATDIASIETCVVLCQQQDATMTATIRTSDGACSCSKSECPEENQLRKGEFKTYTLVGAGGSVDPINCGGSWSSWSVCDGVREERHFTVTQIPRYGGSECPITPEYRACYLPNVDCEGTWSTWSTCDGSYETRSFTVTQQPVNFGLQCPLSPERRVCTLPPVDCDGTWSAWGSCTNGKQQRTFTVTQQPQNSGAACPTSPQLIDCTLQPIDCDGTWSAWSSCVDGKQERSFTVTQIPEHSGIACPASPQSIDCTLPPVDCDGTWSAWGQCNNGNQQRTFTVTQQPENSGAACPESPQTIDCTDDLPVDCDGTWSTWSTCTNGNQQRTFTVTQQPENSGAACPTSPQTITCTLPPVDCDGTWSGWSTCTNGKQERTFTVTQQPEGSGNACPTSPHILDCTGNEQHCEYTQNPWSECDKGTQTRTYTIITPGGGGSSTPFDLDFGNSGSSHYVYNSQNDPDISLCLNQKYNFKRTTYGHTLRVVKSSDCSGCNTGTYSSLPTSSLSGWSDASSGYPSEYTFTETGNYYYVCTAHSSMVGLISVTACGGQACPNTETRSCVTCSDDSKCVSGICRGTHCCLQDYPLCGACTVDGYCQSCTTNAEFQVDGTCGCVSGYHESNGECVLSARRRLRATRCGPDMELVDGRCVQVNCNKKYNSTNMIFRHGMGCIRQLKSSHLLPSCSTDADCPTATTNGQCKGGVCCHKDYEDTTNCQTCNDGVSVWRYEVRDGYLAGGLEAEANCMDDKINCMEIKEQIGCSITDNRISGCKKTCAGETGYPACDNNLNFIQPYGYEYAISECDRLADCKGIYHVNNKNEWYLRDETTVTQVGGYETYKKMYEPTDFCSLCIPGATYIKDRQRCKGLSCPVGQEFIDGIGCQTVKGEADKTMQVPVQMALSSAWCSPGFYRDKVSNECQPIQMHPMIDVTLFIDEGREDEVSMTFGCEVWGPNLVKCPQCACSFDAIYGKWSSFECETCLKGYGQKQCRKQCPGYDGENDISMCNGFGTCSMGSILNKTSELRSFQDATCTCGNPPGSVNEARTEMNVYNSFYTELTTITELSNVVACHNTDILEAELVDTCYHFDMSFADCATCEFGFSGKNCRYQCEKCLAGGRCDSTPSDKESSLCECPSDLKAGLWSYNCCPIGFMVVDIDGFNAIPQETPYTAFSIDDIGLNSIYLPEVHDDTTTTGYNKAKRNADYWCKPCPGVDTSLWLSPQAQYQVCGGVNRGECYRDTISTPNQMACTCFVGNGGVFVEDSSGTMVAVTSEDYGGEACRCRPQDHVPFVNLQLDYGCFDQGACLNKVQYLVIGDVKNPGANVEIPVACSPNAGYYTRLKQSVDPGSGEIVREIEIVEAHVGTHVPFNNFLYLTDESGSPNNYVDLDADGNIGPGVVKAYEVSGIAYAGVEVIGLRCNNGYYQDERGQTTCKQCPAGKFTPGVANHVENSNKFGFNLVVPQWETFEAYTQCYDCPPGRAVTAGQSQCLNCVGGYYQNEIGKGECKVCPTGKITIPSNNADTAGVGRATGYIECTTCPLHTQAQNVIQDFDKTGDMDDYVSSGGTICVQCAPGSDNHNGGQCDWCAAGKYRDVNTVSTVAAENGCKNCPAGRYSSATATPDGTQADNSVTKYSSDIIGSSRCDPCPKGRYQNQNGQYNCKSCAGGQWQDGTASTGCKNCPDGTYMVVKVWDTENIVADTSRDTESDCYSCGTGTRGRGAGYSTFADGCENCPAGQYQDSNRQANCKNCPKAKYVGTTGSGAASDCKTCPKGKYGDQTGLGSCKNCPKGRYLDSTGNDAESDCKVCPRGKYLDSTGNDAASDCKACPAGRGTRRRPASAGFTDHLGDISSGACWTCTSPYTGPDAPGDQDLNRGGCGTCSWTDKNYPGPYDFAGNDCGEITSVSRSHSGPSCWKVYCTFNCAGNPCPGGYSLHGNYPDHSSCPGFECRRECQANTYCSARL